MEKVFVKPKHGLKVRDPHTKLHLPDEGKEVEMNTYWLKRIEAGDVIKHDETKNKKGK